MTEAGGQADYEERIALLESFHNAIRRWFDGEYQPEGREGLKQSINRSSAAVRQAVIEAGCFRRINVAPPPAIGGMVVQGADLFDLIFENLWGMSVIPQLADTVDRAVGVYRAQQDGADLVPPVPKAAPAAAGPDWNALHPSITSVSRSRFESGHLADSVEAAMKAVNRRVKDLYYERTSEEKDGAELMFAAFGGETPVIVLHSLVNDSGRNIQQGYTHLFAGAMKGVRNPKAHDNIELSARRAVHHLFLSSLLMEKLDEAKDL